MLRKTPLRRKAKKDNPGEDKRTRKRSSEPDYVADMDKVFQFWVRLRDTMPGGYCRCISCGKIKPFDHIQAGHYMSRRHMSIRWNPDNCNGECDFCNGRDGDHLIGYRENLIRKIGEGKVRWLEAARNETRKWSDFEIKLMIKHYSKEVLHLSASKGIPVSKTVLGIIKRYEKKRL